MNEWYFTRYGQQVGPVNAAQLQLEIDNGRVGPDDLVWNSTMTDWQPLRNVPQFSRAVSAGVAPGAQVLSYGGGGGGDGTVTNLSIQLLAQTQPWVRFISVLLFVGGSINVLVSLAVLATSASGVPGGSFFLLQALLNLAVAAAIFAQAIYLWKYASSIAALRTNARASALEAALAAQKSFWRIAGIIALTFLCLVAVIFVIGFIAAIYVS